MKEADITVCNNDPYLTVQKVFRKWWTIFYLHFCKPNGSWVLHFLYM